MRVLQVFPSVVFAVVVVFVVVVIVVLREMFKNFYRDFRNLVFLSGIWVSFAAEQNCIELMTIVRIMLACM